MTALVIDANLLALLVVGETGRENVARHKRTRQYSTEDYEDIVRLVLPPRRLVVCAHVLAETSNLVRLTNEPLKSTLTRVLGALIEKVEEADTKSAGVVGEANYVRLGLTDAILLTLIERDGTLLSDDLDLCLAAERAGRRVINYNYVREGALSLDDL